MRSDPAEDFLDDLRAALTAWRSVPWLPVISVLLGSSSWAPGSQQFLERADPDTGAPLDDGTLTLIVLILVPVSLLAIGWLGTAREVYRRVWLTDEPYDRRLLRTTTGYVGRFLRLGLLVGWPWFVAVLVVGATAGAESPAASITSFVLNLGLFVVLTFVTPELAYHTPRATRAFSSGVALLASRAGDVRWHALLPPVLLATLTTAVGVLELPGPVRVMTGSLGSLAGVALSGAIAHRWLRLRDGARVDALPERT